MAAQSTVVNTALSIKYKDGVDANGKDIIKAKKFANVKVTASADELLFVGTSLGSLMKYELTDILRIDDSVIANA